MILNNDNMGPHGDFSVQKLFSRSAFLATCLAWTIMLSVLGTWHYQSQTASVENIAQATANMMIEKDFWYRRWATMHGGVYVPVTSETQPNPYLEGFVAERDLTTPSGRRLTLINPAYMTRQVYELGSKEASLIGHMTSLKPIRPENSPDAWEKEALLAFEKGSSEYSARVQIENAPYLRLMKPFVTEQGCLKCHEQQGYKVGDIRGGLSVALPLTPYITASQKQLLPNLAVMVLVWMIGFVGIWMIFSLGDRRTAASLNQELNLVISERTAALAEKNREMELFVSMVSHDLQNPLITINGFSHLLRHSETLQADEKSLQLLDHIDKAAATMSHLIKDVLSYARLGKGQLKLDIVDLQEVFIFSLSSLGEKITDSRAKLTLPENSLLVSGNLDLLCMVFVNLLQNAIKYTSTDKTPEIVVTAEERKGMVLITVSDNGIGIDEKDCKEIFEPYHRVDESGQGYGMGLASARKALAIQGGRIWLESVPGAGSTFYVELAGVPVDKAATA